MPTPPRGAVNQRALARLDAGRAMQHLVGRDVVEDQADCLAGIQPGRHRDQLALGQAYKLGVGTVDWHRGDCPARLDAGDAGADTIDNAHQVPPRREGDVGRLRMDPLAGHDVGQGDPRGQHSHTRFALPGLRLFFFDHLEGIESAVMGDDDARVLHGPLLRLPGAGSTLFMTSDHDGRGHRHRRG